MSCCVSFILWCFSWDCLQCTEMMNAWGSWESLLQAFLFVDVWGREMLIYSLLKWDILHCPSPLSGWATAKLYWRFFCYILQTHIALVTFIVGRDTMTKASCRRKYLVQGLTVSGRLYGRHSEKHGGRQEDTVTRKLRTSSLLRDHNAEIKHQQWHDSFGKRGETEGSWNGENVDVWE